MDGQQSEDMLMGGPADDMVLVGEGNVEINTYRGASAVGAGPGHCRLAVGLWSYYGVVVDIEINQMAGDSSAGIFCPPSNSENTLLDISEEDTVWPKVTSFALRSVPAPNCVGNGSFLPVGMSDAFGSGHGSGQAMVPLRSD